jgi:hypothetical protein
MSVSMSMRRNVRNLFGTTPAKSPAAVVDEVGVRGGRFMGWRGRELAACWRQGASPHRAWRGRAAAASFAKPRRRMNVARVRVAHSSPKEAAMSETVIGLFPQSQEADELVPMLTNRGIGRSDVDVIGGRGASLSGTGADLTDKLARLGVADAGQQESFVEGVSHGGTVVAARAPDPRRAEQLLDLMQEHGATTCTHVPDTGWTTT